MKKQCEHSRHYSSGRITKVNKGIKKDFKIIKNKFLALKRKVLSSSPKRPLESYDKLLDRGLRSRSPAFKQNVIQYFDADGELGSTAYEKENLDNTLRGLRNASQEIGGPLD